MALPIKSLASKEFKGQKIKDFKNEERLKLELIGFKKYCQDKEREHKHEKDHIKEDSEESIFSLIGTYRVNNTPFPVYQGSIPAKNFPILPIGMLDAWK
jgi:hypothetical protein